MTSLSGKRLRLRKDKFLISADKKQRIKVTSKDLAFYDSKSTYKRMILDNSLDERYYSSSVAIN